MTTFTTEQLQQIAELFTALISAKSTDKPASGKGKSTAPKSEKELLLEKNYSRIKELQEQNKQIRAEMNAEKRKQKNKAWYDNLSEQDRKAFLASKQEKRDIKEKAYQNVCKALEGKPWVSKKKFNELLNEEVKRLSAKK